MTLTRLSRSLITAVFVCSIGQVRGQAPSDAPKNASQSFGRSPVASGATLLSEATGLAGAAMFLDSGAPGMVLVVVRGQDTAVEGYGETAKGNGREPNGRSLLRLGSVSKAFAGEVLAGQVAKGNVRLSDALRLYAAGATVPSFGTREITLLDLATHSAGLLREIGPVPPDRIPFTGPTKAERWAWLSKFQLPWAPGSVASYSNVGFDLLTDALSLAGKKSYANLLHEQITGPLGMADTGFSPTKEQCQLLMLGSGLGGPGACVDTQATAGSGGLYSTGNDMALWLRHNIASDPATWPALAIAHAVYLQRQALTAANGFDEGGPMSGIGLAWITMDAHGITPMILEKSGGGGGFMTYVAFAPGRDVGVFVAVNRVNFAMFYSLAGAANELIANLVAR